MARKLSLPNGRQDGNLDLEVDGLDADRLERELEGNGSESDSSLDLHTPFAYVVSLSLFLLSRRSSHGAFFPLGMLC